MTRMFVILTFALSSTISNAFCAAASAPGQTAATVAASAAPRPKVDPSVILNQIPGQKFKKNWPDNFPVPKYPSNITQTNFIFTTKGLPAATASVMTSDNVQTVFNWYQNACKTAGWTVKLPSDESLGNQKGKLFMLQGSKPKEQITLVCTPLKKKTGTTISITWSKTP